MLGKEARQRRRVGDRATEAPGNGQIWNSLCKWVGPKLRYSTCPIPGHPNSRVAIVLSAADTLLKLGCLLIPRQQHALLKEFRGSQINRWRDSMENGFQSAHFPWTARYYEMRPHLDEASRMAISKAARSSGNEPGRPQMALAYRNDMEPHGSLIRMARRSSQQPDFLAALASPTIQRTFFAAISPPF